ncbi:MAG: universal stress protein [Clostridiales bacterium]|nr:universal stress protein [Clostridiales bacterium]
MVYKKILVAIDGSDSSKRAYQHALSLARLSGAEVLLVHVAISPEDTWGGYATASKLINMDELNAITKEIIDSTFSASDAEGVDVSTIILHGKPAKEIVKAAFIENVDLIITGGHSLGSVSNLFQGSVSLRIVQTAHCPVMVINDHPGIHSEVAGQ